MRQIIFVCIICSFLSCSAQRQVRKSVFTPVSNRDSGYCSYPEATGPVNTPLMVAIWQGDIATVKSQLHTVATLNILFPLDCSEGHKLQTTPLIHAIQSASTSRFRLQSQAMVKFLLEHGAEANFSTSEEPAPLQMAASLGNISPDITKTLLRYGAKVDGRDRNGETALLIAAQRENGPAVIRELVAAGADFHAVNGSGINAVMLAAWQHYQENVKLLVDIGIDACARDKEGKTAIDWAKTNLNEDPAKPEIISFLQGKCGNK